MNKTFVLEESLLRKIPSIKKSEQASRARSLMRDLGYRILVVTDDLERVIGVIWRENILAIASSKTTLLVSDIMQEPLLTASLGDPLNTLLKKMLELDTWYVPVVNDQREMIYRGVFGFEHFMEKILREHSIINRLKEFRAKDIMSKDPISVKPNMFVSTLWKNMIKYKFAGFPVTDDHNRVIGFVSQQDLLRATIAFQSESGPRKGYKISSLMNRPAIVAREDTDIAEIIKILVSKNIGRIPVVSEENKLVGIIDRSDIVKIVLDIGII
ncbi:MAG: CBS domain-containing protein [Sulfolobales archaeon]